MSAEQQQQQQQTESVEVAVRIRPLNQLERDAKSEIIIRTQDGNKVFIKNPDTEEERNFTFNHAFESFDNKEVGGPLAVPDQKQFFDTVVAPTLKKDVLEQGRNLLLINHGEINSGKSYTVLGNDNRDEAGILRRVCDQTLDKVAEDKKTNIKSSVSLQVVEIYCEQVNDLLTDREKWPENGHAPKLTKDGFIVETAVKNIEKMADVEEALECARNNRTEDSISHKSRSHIIYGLRYTKKGEGEEAAPVSSGIEIVDLAGSERVESAQISSGQMLKESNAINLSLSALGNCIHALSEGKRPGFSDSKLTLLLQGSMTSGKAIMIAAVSPASICYEESLPTLRFADRFKKVDIQSQVNNNKNTA